MHGVAEFCGVDDGWEFFDDVFAYQLFDAVIDFFTGNSQRFGEVVIGLAGVFI